MLARRTCGASYDATAMDNDLLKVMRAMADVVRLRALGRLADGPATVSELSVALGVGPSTMRRHIDQLKAAGLVERAGERPDAAFALRIEAVNALARRLGELDGIPTAQEPEVVGPDGSPLPAEDARVVRAFIVDDRLVSIPAQDRKRQVILRYLRERCFGEDREYPEKEVNQRLALFHRDVASLRRYLVDSGLMTREAGIYRRAAG